MPDPARIPGPISNPLDTMRGAEDLAEYVAHHLSRLLPKGLRCKIQLVLDGSGIIDPSNVDVSFRKAKTAKTGGPGSGNGRFGR